MNKLNTVLFYTIEKAIKTYRQYAQKQLKEYGLKITLDQWLVVKSIIDNPEITQQEIAEKVFKDNASITRIIELLVKAKYLKRTVNKVDKRRSNLTVTTEGEKVFEEVYRIVLNNRATALNNVNLKDLEITSKVLKEIINNCN